MPPPASPGYQSAPYTHAAQGPHVNPYGQAPAPSPTVVSAQTPTDPLEQRVLDLLYPYRDECFKEDDGMTVARERAALILCENIAFLIRHNQSSYGKRIDTNDVSIISRNWQGMKQFGGSAGLGVFVNGNGFTHTVLRITVSSGENAIDRFMIQVDSVLQTFFPEV
ncbi:hypothetical protein BDU57DRAFT_553665 [Ampelomyces quisqualis]|uniref:Uncharacterized protein n=1 Tax=Ampelomyces quisqualis TaxID=50730 RepID=A0A6A5R3I1_AMPQU|nr:hypothetical protein BDU57DRAFT_553665 [Ampelomyces quisqualis]